MEIENIKIKERVNSFNYRVEIDEKEGCIDSHTIKYMISRIIIKVIDNYLSKADFYNYANIDDILDYVKTHYKGKPYNQTESEAEK